MRLRGRHFRADGQSADHDERTSASFGARTGDSMLASFTEGPTVRRKNSRTHR